MKLRHLLFGRKAITNLDSVLKSRDITLLTKVYIVKAMVFPVVMYTYESWPIKKAKQQNAAFESWCWTRPLRVPWTAKRSNQSILKEINPEYSLEGVMLKLKLQYFGHLIGKDPDAEKDWGQEGKGATENEMASSIQWTWVWKNWVIVKDGEVWRAAVHVVSKGQTRPRDNRAILISTVLLLVNIYELLNQWCRWALSGWKIRYCPCFWLISQADFPDGPVVKNPPASTGDTGSIPGPGRSHKPQGSEASQWLNPKCWEPVLYNKTCHCSTRGQPPLTATGGGQHPAAKTQSSWSTVKNK